MKIKEWLKTYTRPQKEPQEKCWPELIAFAVMVWLLIGLIIFVGRSEGADLENIASVIAAEAACQGKIGMQAVGAVIQNRAESRKISPDAVIKQRNQFYGWTASNRTRLYAQVKNIADEIAQQVIDGTLEDVTGGAEYFLLPGERVRAWHGEKTVTLGEHTFYRERKN